MSKLILLLVTTLAAAFAQDIPAGAVKIDANTRLEEKGTAGKPGKVYVYRKTPFGLSGVEVKPEAAPSRPSAAADSAIQVKDLGDSYRFERPDPFGNKVWISKKTELTPGERAIVEKSEQHADAGKKATN